MSPASPQVSIVVPLYDEEENVAPLSAAVVEALEGWDRSWELLLVDDGSRDRTLERCREAMRCDQRVRVLTLKANAGQTQAMAAGFQHARGGVVVSMDGDLQNDPRDIPRLVSELEAGHDLVCGWRRDRQDAWLLRILPSKVANWMIARLTGIPIHDNGCSLKAYRAELTRALRLYSDMHRFLPALSSMAGARIAEVVVRHHARARGASKYGLTRTFKVLADMITIRMLTRFGNRPGAWFSLLALPWLLLGAATGVFWVVGVWAFGLADTVVLPSLAVMFSYLAVHLLGLALASEISLVHGDRSYLARLVEVLSSSGTVRPRPGDGDTP